MASLQGPIEQPYDDQWQGLLATVHSFDLEFFLADKQISKCICMNMKLDWFKIKNFTATIFNVYIFGMESSSGQWILVDIFFQNGQILVDTCWEGIPVDTFHTNSSCWWIFVDIFLVNSRGSQMVPTLLVSQPCRRCGVEALAWISKHCSVLGLGKVKWG